MSRDRGGSGHVQPTRMPIAASTHSPEAQTNFPAERVELPTRDTSAKL
jgi:hypothetical protein